MADKNTAEYKQRKKELTLNALADPKFRKALATNPQEALKKQRLSAEALKEIYLVLAAVRNIETQFQH